MDSFGITVKQGLHIILLTQTALSAVFFYSRSRIDSDYDNNTKKRMLIRALLVIGCLFYLFIVVSRQLSTEFENPIGGNDVYSYRWFFELADTDVITYFENPSVKGEVLYRTFTWIIRQFTSDYRWSMIIFHGIAYWCTWYFVRNLQIGVDVVSFVGIFLILNNLFQMFTMYRNGMAIALFMVFLTKIKKKNIYGAILYALAAFGFHRSCIIAIFLWGYVFIRELIEKSDRRLYQSMVFGALSLAFFVAIPMSLYVKDRSLDSYFARVGEITPGRMFLVILCFLLISYGIKLSDHAMLLREMLILYLPFFVLNLVFIEVERFSMIMVIVLYEFVLELFCEKMAVVKHSLPINFRWFCFCGFIAVFFFARIVENLKGYEGITPYIFIGCSGLI